MKFFHIKQLVRFVIWGSLTWVIGTIAYAVMFLGPIDQDPLPKVGWEVRTILDGYYMIHTGDQVGMISRNPAKSENVVPLYVTGYLVHGDIIFVRQVDEMQPFSAGKHRSNYWIISTQVDEVVGPVDWESAQQWAKENTTGCDLEGAKWNSLGGEEEER